MTTLQQLEADLRDLRDNAPDADLIQQLFDKLTSRLDEHDRELARLRTGDQDQGLKALITLQHKDVIERFDRADERYVALNNRVASLRVEVIKDLGHIITILGFLAKGTAIEAEVDNVIARYNAD
jgi:hypothetical protein